MQKIDAKRVILILHGTLFKPNRISHGIGMV